MLITVTIETSDLDGKLRTCQLRMLQDLAEDRRPRIDGDQHHEGLDLGRYKELGLGYHEGISLGAT